MTMPTESSSVPLAYRDVERVLVLCLVQKDGAIAHSAEERVCKAAARIAGAGTGIPVETVAAGDPRMVAPGSLTVLVHGGVSGPAGREQVAIAVRPYRAGVSGAEVLFGAAPRTAPLGDEAALTATLSASLDEILPWRLTTSGVRRID